MGSLGKLAPPKSAMRPSGLPQEAGSRPPNDSLHQDYRCTPWMESVLKSSTMTTTDSNSTLDDRIGRGRYWAELAIFTLSSSLIYGVGIVAIVFAVLAGGQAGAFLLFIVFAGFQLALTWRFLGYGAKRCHDLGHSGFYQLIPLYPLLMLFQEGDIESNEYGPNPNKGSAK